jgi:hypothetical protein
MVIPSCLLAQSEEGFVSLMPNKEIAEHWVIVESSPEAWWLENGVIASAGKPMGVLRSKRPYKNYILRAEWRFKSEGWTGAPDKWPNAGFFIHASEELREQSPRWPASFIEIQGHFGQAGSLFGRNAIQGGKRGPIVKNRIPFGEWDRVEIASNNGTVRVVLNGEVVNEGHGADPDQGYICLQAEGWPVYYRNVRIKVLPD